MQSDSLRFEANEERLLEGASLNVVGLSGSGRSNWLDRFTRHLVDAGWGCRFWSLVALRAMGKAEMKSAVEALRRDAQMPVLLIDDFGAFLVETNGPWLERLLFGAVHQTSDEGANALQVVLVTTPRDREIIGPASLLRERCHVVVAAPLEVSGDHVELLGCSDNAEVERFMGLSTHLLPSAGRTPESERGLLQQRCYERLPRLVGELDGQLHRRLGTILRRSDGARWRPQEGDSLLRPLVVGCPQGEGLGCVVPEVVDHEELGALLLSERWPERDLKRSARRFAARCGNEPRPIWTDNYLSDTNILDFRALARFMNELMRYRPDGTMLRLLSRDFVGAAKVSPHELRSALLGAALGPDARERIEWRIYDKRAQGNLHQRELSLPRRGVGFSLPTAQMIVGQVPLGNESDAEIPLFENRPAQETWRNARAVQLLDSAPS